MLVHRRVTPPANIKLAGIHLYTWVERGSGKVKRLAQATAQCPRPGLEPARSGVERANHEATTMRKATYKLFIMIVILNEQLCAPGKLGKELLFYIFKCKMKNSTTKIADTIYCLFIRHRCWTSQENRFIKGKIHFYISLISRIQFAGRCKGEIFVRNAKRSTSCMLSGFQYSTKEAHICNAYFN